MAKTTEPSTRWRCTFLFLWFAALLCCGEGQRISVEETDGLKSWGDLDQEAGYFTQSGLWKGGLPMLHRSSRPESYSCESIHATYGFCLRWVGGYVEQRGPLNQEYCICTSSNSYYCEEWECRRTRDFEPCEQRVQDCIKDRETRITSCTCDRESDDYFICQEWSCQEFTIFGREQSESYVCLEEDESLNFCHRWKGDATSDSHIKSTVCECFDGDDNHCRLWICELREITRCSASGHFMCDIQFAIIVCGGLGVAFNLFLLGIAACIRADWRDRSLLALSVFVIGFLMLMLPLLLGAALTGGLYGIGWVLLIWTIPTSLYIYYGSRSYKKNRLNRYRDAADGLP